MKYLFLISFCYLLFSCAKSTEKKEEKVSITNDASENVVQDNWKDSLIKEYLKNPKDELIKSAVNDNDSLPVVWMTETQERDGKIYTAVQIGQNFEHRFATSGWIYLDSTNKKVFELDVANDSLILWKK